MEIYVNKIYFIWLLCKKITFNFNNCPKRCDCGQFIIFL